MTGPSRLRLGRETCANYLHRRRRFAPSPTARLQGVIFGLSLLLAGSGAVDVRAAAICDQPKAPFCDSTIAPPQNWGGRRFHLSQDYPSAPHAEPRPWMAIDPKSRPLAYLKSVLDYFYEGNIHARVEDSFDPRLNHVRAWYNAPWQDFGMNGREPIHGLTRERVSQPFELSPDQRHPWNNYAIGFYNRAGGLMIGRVWADHGRPNPALASAPDGTVAAKLLFTTAPVAEVPYLQGAPVWRAFVFADANAQQPDPSSPRAILPLRLVQIDIAVKDPRAADTTGWIFGTFVYGGGPGGKPGEGWRHVEPVGVMWGDDPGYSGLGRLKQTVLNSAVHMPHLGYQGRLNGPVDNPVSSCLSCHSTAEEPASLAQLISILTPPTGEDPARWFQNLPSGVAFTKGKQSLDDSLQMAFGLASFNAVQEIARAPNGPLRQKLKLQALKDQAKPARGGSPD